MFVHIASVIMEMSKLGPPGLARYGRLIGTCKHTLLLAAANGLCRWSIAPSGLRCCAPLRPCTCAGALHYQVCTEFLGPYFPAAASSMFWDQGPFDWEATVARCVRRHLPVAAVVGCFRDSSRPPGSSFPRCLSMTAVLHNKQLFVAC